MPPVAKRWLTYSADDPRSSIQQALNERFPDSLEIFFEQVGAAAGVRPDSASGTFYGFMGANRSLPPRHKEAYMRLLQVNPAIIEAIEAMRERASAPPTDLMADLQAKVNEMAQQLRKVDELEYEVRRVDHRVSRLEDRLT